ncbi:MAG: hypothetical protein ACQEQU_02370 [Spirochaetota bacterium]
MIKPKTIGIRMFFLLLMVLVTFSGCTVLQARLEGVPVWTLEKPTNNLTKVFFVGVGESEIMNEMTARQLAYEDVLSDVSDFLGYDVTDTYQRELLQTQVIEDLELEVTEEFVKEQDGTLTLYILAEANRKTISALVRANISDTRQDESRISATEDEAANAYRKQNDYLAFSLYIKGALEAYNSNLADGKRMYGDLMAKALDVLRGLQLKEMSSDPDEGAFSARVTRGTGLFSPKIGGVPVKAVYPVINQAGVERQQSMQAQTDSRGKVTFSPNHTVFRGSGTFVIYLDISNELERLTEEVGSDDPYVEQMRSTVAEKQLKFSYSISSAVAGKNIVTGILEYNSNGVLLAEHSALATFNRTLEENGFLTASLFGEGEEPSLEQLLQRARTQYAATRKMALLGEAGISSRAQSGSSLIVSVKGNVRAYKLDDGTMYAESGTLAASGKGETIEAARKEAFSRFGQISASIMIGKLL